MISVLVSPTHSSSNRCDLSSCTPTSQLMPSRNESMATIPTLNGKGFMFDIDATNKAFIDFAVTHSSPSHPAVEIGAAYGAATIPAVERGAYVIANDLSGQHLEILRKRVSNKNANHLVTIQGSFPEKVQFGVNNISCMLISNVLHFMDAPTIAKALNDVYQALIPDGRVFIVIASPLFDVPIREELIAPRRKAGNPWPGYVNLSNYLNDWLSRPVTKHSLNQQEINDYMTITEKLIGMYNVMDIDELVDVVERAGFDIEEKGEENLLRRVNSHLIARKRVTLD